MGMLGPFLEVQMIEIVHIVTRNQMDI